MEYERAKLLSIGEFAELLNTTRATLVHYDSLGILRPAHVADNGYRYYLPEQSQTYLIIELFTTCGLSLKELKSYLDTLDESQGEALVEKSLGMVKKRVRQLNQVRRLMESKQDLYRLALEHENELPFIAHMGAQRYIRSTIRGLPASWQELQTDHSISVARYLADHDEFPEHPFAGRMTIDEAEDGTITLSAPVERNRQTVIYSKPKGAYVCVIRKSATYSRKDVVRTLIDYASEQGFRTIGDLFMIDTVNFVITNKESEYSTLYQIQVERV